jgi:hypothetical protein
VHARLGAAVARRRRRAACDLTGAGYNAISEPTWAEVKGWGQVRGIAIHDPDGLLIEFYASEEAA